MERLGAALRHLRPTTAATAPAAAAAPPPEGEMRAGVIGLDGPAGVATARLLSSGSRGCRVVACYDRGIYPRPSSVHSSAPHHMHGTILSLVTQVPQHEREMEALGIPQTETIAELLELVDVVFLMTRDGRPRLEQAAEVLRARKPLFMDHPVSSNLADAMVIYALAEGLGVPCCSASPLRWAPACQAARAGELGVILGAEARSPADIDQEAIELGHLELCWEASHGIELLFAAVRAVLWIDLICVVGVSLTIDSVAARWASAAPPSAAPATPAPTSPSAPGALHRRQGRASGPCNLGSGDGGTTLPTAGAPTLRAAPTRSARLG